MYGYETGDRFLKYWADCIRETLEPYETFGRISGDKFVVLRSFERSEELEERFRWITEKLNGFAGDSRRFRVELACGAYRMEKPEDRLSLNEMLDRANIAEKALKAFREAIWLFMMKRCAAGWCRSWPWKRQWLTRCVKRSLRCISSHRFP